MKRNNPLVKEWLQLGDDDLKYAELGLEEGPYNLSCFHSQQAVEKYFKGLLTACDIEFPKTHRLEQLLQLAAPIDKSLAQFEDDARYLDGFYIGTRYAGGVFETFSKEEAEKALDMAKDIAEAIRKLIE